MNPIEKPEKRKQRNSKNFQSLRKLSWSNIVPELTERLQSQVPEAMTEALGPHLDKEKITKAALRIYRRTHQRSFYK